MRCCSAARIAPSRRLPFWLGVRQGRSSVQGDFVVVRSLMSLTEIVNVKSVIISALAVLSTWLSLKLGWKADFPLTLIATAIVFPLVFSISTAYTRREKALEEYGALKANGRALYLASRDWVVHQDEQRDAELRSALHELLSATRDMFMRPVAESRR